MWVRSDVVWCLGCGFGVFDGFLGCCGWLVDCLLGLVVCWFLVMVWLMVLLVVCWLLCYVRFRG